MKIADFHVHTGIASPCAQQDATVENYLALCKQESVSVIGFADHFWDTDMKARPEEVCNWDFFKRIYQTIPVDTKGVKVLVGCETDMDGDNVIGVDRERAKSFDFVLIPTNHYHIKANRKAGLDVNDLAILKKHNIERFFLAANSDLGVHTCLCHPFLNCGCSIENRELHFAAMTDNEYLDCFKEAKRKGVAIEIHSDALFNIHKRKDKDGYSYEYLRLYSLANECGVSFQFGSDAHSLRSGSECFAFGHQKLVQFVKRCGIKPSSIITDIEKQR